MSRYSEERAAISAAIEAADPGAQVWDYMRYPVDATYNGLVKLFGETVKGGETRINTWVFSRTGIPQDQNLESAFGSQWNAGMPVGTNAGEIVTLTNTYQLLCWKTLIDQPTDGTQPTEYAFQETIDSVMSMLRNHAAIRTLLHENSADGDGYVDNIRADEISQHFFAGEKICHYALLTLTFVYPRTLA